MKLFKVRISSYAIANADQLAELTLENPEFRWKTIEDFPLHIWSSSSEEEKLEKTKERDAKWKTYQSLTTREFVSPDILVVDLAYFAAKFPWLKFSVEESVEAHVEPIVKSIQSEIDAMNDILDRFKELEITSDARTFNSQCDVHIGGGLLMQINDLMLCEDSCTDDIQSKLDGGWRIVSVCVQPDGRRPDYILGRFNPNQESSNYARRG